MTSLVVVLAHTVAIGVGLIGLLMLDRALARVIDPPAPMVIMTLLAGWYGLTAALGIAGVFRADNPLSARFPVIGLALVVPLIALLVATWRTPRWPTVHSG